MAKPRSFAWAIWSVRTWKRFPWSSFVQKNAFVFIHRSFPMLMLKVKEILQIHFLIWINLELKVQR